MGRPPVSASLDALRRLVVTKQRLAGELPRGSGSDRLRSVVRDLGFVQWDPVSVVAPSHVLSFWARVGDFPLPALDRLLWKERRLLLLSIPMASIVSAEDYPIYASLMRRYPDSLTRSWGDQREQARRFLAQHEKLRTSVLRALEGGPLRIDQFQEHDRTRRKDGEWTPTSDLSQMLSHLALKGEVMIVGYDGPRNLWGRTDAFLPPSIDRGELSAPEMERAAALRAIRALGAATPREVHFYFVRGRYEDVDGAVRGLEEDGEVRRLRIPELGSKDERYVHESDLPLLDERAQREWRPRVSLLPPFDTMLGSTARTELLFGFHYIRAQFLPKEKRKFGTWVLPILWGDRFVGQIDPKLDRESSTLRIQSVHAEPDAPRDPTLAAEIAATIDRLRAFLGADRVSYPAKVPAPWARELR